MIGIVVELFSIVPSVILVQLFRRLESRDKQISPLRQALNKINPSLQIFADPSQNNTDEKKKKKKKRLPWWCIFLVYGLCVMLVVISIIFIIARGIEFGDTKSAKWLTSVVSGFLSSNLLIQPIKVTSFFICFES